MGHNQIDFALEKPHDKTRGGIRMSFFFIVFFIGAVVVSFLSLVGCSEGSMTKIAQADLAGEWCYSSFDGKPSRTKIEFKSDGTFTATDLHGIVLDVNAIDLITAGDWTLKKVDQGKLLIELTVRQVKKVYVIGGYVINKNGVLSLRFELGDPDSKKFTDFVKEIK